MTRQRNFPLSSLAAGFTARTHLRAVFFPEDVSALGIRVGDGVRLLRHRLMLAAGRADARAGGKAVGAIATLVT